MSIIIPANSAVGGGGLATNSLRFNKASSDYLNRTPSSNGSKTTNTISFWLKRSLFSGGTVQRLFSQLNTGGSGNPDDYITFDDVDKINFQFYGNGSSGVNNGYLVTNRVFRDNAAWYHIVAVQDTTNGTSGDRLRLYINGVRETSFSTANYPSQNTQGGAINNTSYPLFIGQRGNSAGYFDGYMAEYCFIDGQALAPTSFGEFNGDSGVWNPIDVSGLTFGTNGFYLQFEESGTGTNASGMGADTSGNDNHFAVNNLTAIDQTTDTCTNNFATLNSLANVIAPVTLTEGNLKIAMTNSKGGNLSTISCTDGKYYAEMKITTAPQDFRFHWGIMPHPVIAADDPINAANAGIMLSGYNAVIYAANGIINNFYGNATGRFSGNPILGLAIDLKSATRTMAISINGAWVTGSNATDTDFSNALKVDITSYVATYPNWFIGCGSGNGSGTTGVYELNFGNPIFTGTDQADGNDRGSFEYPPPSGYLALCTKNLSGELS